MPNLNDNRKGVDLTGEPGDALELSLQIWIIQFSLSSKHQFEKRELKIDGISLNAGCKMEEIVQIVGARKSPESRPNLPSIFTQIWKQSKKNIEAADAPQRTAEWAGRQSVLALQYFPTVGFDPTSTPVAEALGLSLLLILDPEALEGYGEECADLEPDWSGYHELDLHRMEAAPV
ncbi:hypothetical protein FB451DRAFT_1170315 [Mycena latifolia]|nr:hypothetical protein FB451DRAFT_1170315 [Mycena latifolia]